MASPFVCDVWWFLKHSSENGGQMTVECPEGGAVGAGQSGATLHNHLVKLSPRPHHSRLVHDKEEVVESVQSEEE